MEILGGLAKGMNLKVPAGREVRPTSVRSRRALFDMLGDLTGKHFCDFFAGSGAVGIEAASRGATHILLVEKASPALGAIRDNVKRAEKFCPEALFQILPGTLPGCLRKLTAMPRPDLVFADPPYAESADLLDAVLKDADFSQWASDALILWELPDYRSPLKVFPAFWQIKTIRDLGASRFLIIEKTQNSI